MLRTLLSFIPFFVCLFWFITFIIHYRKSDTSKRYLTWFLGTCVILYLCHALFFTVGLSHSMECLWTLCFLSVYPLYYVYICSLVSRPIAPLKLFFLFLPGSLSLQPDILFLARRWITHAKYYLPFRCLSSCFLDSASSVSSTKR